MQSVFQRFSFTKFSGRGNIIASHLQIEGFMLRYVLVFILLPVVVLAHEEKLSEIQVQEREETQGLVDFVPSVKKLKGNELTKKRQTSIGDTLATEAGVQSTSFGPNASRPVIRGLDGDRIRVLQNSLGTLDASTQSLDHAIPVDTLTIDQMDIVRGPMALLYGSSAVGGVVNLVTNRIHYEYEEGFFSKLLTQGETVNNGISNALHLNYGADKMMFHFDGSTRNLGDVKVPTTSNPKDKIANSFNQQDNLAVGVSKILDRGYYGLSFNHFNTLYGSVADESVSIDMTQNRFEFHSEFRPESGGIRKWKLKSAQSDYFHKEIESGATGTTFSNVGNESRLEALTKSEKWDGVTGLQSQIFNFKAVGDEAFIPSSQSKKVSIFTFQQLSLGSNAFRFGGRLENHHISKDQSTNFGASDEKGFLGYNASIGHCYDFNKKKTLETSLSYTERAPTFQELYSNGPHLATGTNEKGNSNLIKEKASAFEITFKDTSSQNQFTGSLYSQLFKDFISLNPNGQVDGDGLPIFNYEQVDALFYGVDFDNKNELQKFTGGVLYLTNKFDYIHARDTDSGHHLPRISPARFSAGLEIDTDEWSADIETQYVADQTKTAPNETRTKDYFYTNLGYTYKVVSNLSSLDLFARVRNIFDVEARNHVSTLKDRAPLPGRNLILGAQFQF
jgi:iron complex outermembrane receptor protein